MLVCNFFTAEHYRSRWKDLDRFEYRLQPIKFCSCETEPYNNYQALMYAGWLQNYFYTIETPNTFENRNVTRYNLRRFTRIFSA